MDSLDLGVLSVVASFGYPEELVGLGLALGKDRAAELMSLTATVDAILMQTRCCVEVRLHFRPKKRWGENGFPRCGGCPAEGMNLIEVTSFGQRSRPREARGGLNCDRGSWGSPLGGLNFCREILAEEERPAAVQELVGRLVDGLYHHGAASVVASDATGYYSGEGSWPSPEEKVHVVSLRGAGGGRVPFIMSHGSVEIAQVAEGDIQHVSLFVKIGPQCERLFTFCFATGDAGPSHSRYVSASRETCARVAAALGIEANEIGYALRTVVVAVDIKVANTSSVWEALEVLARNDNGSPYFWWIFYEGTGLTEEEESASWLFNGPACTTFPFECALARPHFMVENPGEGDGIGMWRRVSESPRKLLFDVQALLESRLHDPARTASLGATVKALNGWQLALDVSRWDRAVAAAVAARAAEQPGMSDEEWANFSFGQGRPKESNCFPFEYIGPAFASRCKCCCPSFRTVQVATKPDNVGNYTWYRDYMPGDAG